MSYWSNRQARALQALEKDETALRKRLNKLYDAEEQRLAREIAAYYKQYGNADGVIEFRTLLEQASPAQKAMIWQDWDAFAAQYPQYAHLTPTRESIYKLNRLEALQASVTYQMTNLNAQANGQLATHLAAQSTAAARMTFETLGHEYNNEIMRAFAEVNHTTAEDFSARIWSDNLEPDTQKISDYVNNELAQALARGDSYERTAKEATTRFRHVEKRYLDRLIYTEGTYAFNQATKNAIQQDFDKYKYDPIEDGKTCAICRALRGKEYELKDAEAGVNFPPMHPWCRCSFTIVTPETEDERDKWVADYITKNGGDKKTAEKILDRFEDKPSEKEKEKEIQKARSDIANWTEAAETSGAISAEDRQRFIDGMSEDETLRALFEKYGPPANYQQSTRGAYYRHASETIALQPADRRDKATTAAHEHGHHFDFKMIDTKGCTFNEMDALTRLITVPGSRYIPTAFPHRASQSDQFLAAYREDRKNLIQTVKATPNFAKTIWEKYLPENYRQPGQRGSGAEAVHDFMDAIGYKTNIMAGHGDKYWNGTISGIKARGYKETQVRDVYRDELGLPIKTAAGAKQEARIYDGASEAWANITEAVFAGGDTLEAVKEYMPAMYNEWLRITKEATES